MQKTAQFTVTYAMHTCRHVHLHVHVHVHVHVHTHTHTQYTTMYSTSPLAKNMSDCQFHILIIWLSEELMIHGYSWGKYVCSLDVVKMTR